MSPVVSRILDARRLPAALACALAMLAFATGSARAESTVTLSVSSDPVEDSQVAITVSGVADPEQRLFVSVMPASRACEPVPQDQSAVAGSQDLTPAFGSPLATGDYERELAFTPADARKYRVCAAVTDDRTSTASALDSTDFVARDPRVDLSVSTGGDAVVGGGVFVFISGSSELARNLFVEVAPATQPCADTPAAQAVRSGSAPLSSRSGDPIDSGNFGTTYTFTPTEARRYRVCGYVGDDASDDPEAKESVDFVVRAAATPTPSPTPTATPSPTPTPAPTPNVTPTPTAKPTPTPPPTPAPTAAAPVGVPLAAVASTPAPPTYRALLTTPADDQDDRLFLTWKVDGSTAHEWITIWDEDPSNEANPVLDESLDDDQIDDDEFTLELGADDERQLSVLHHLGYRQFWWQITTTTPSGAKVKSDIGTVRVVPSPMDEASVRISPKLTLKHSSAHPGTVRLRIHSSPRARVSLRVTYGGRVVARKRYTEGVGALRGVEFPLSCSKPGKYSYEAVIKDPYGAQVTRRGFWNSSVTRCNALKAEERAKALAAQRRASAKRRAAEEKRRREEQSSSGGSGGGSSSGGNCDPNYTGACLTPGIGDYDCQGGSGDGPNYVQGPITVVGSDPYRLDADGDGVACES